MDKRTSVSRSVARGAGARGTTGLNTNGADAYKQARKSTSGHYRIEFSKMFEHMTDKDVELRVTYGKDLVAQSVGVPVDMVTLKMKRQGVTQTLTSLDEVFYVKIGQDTAGKLSIRTLRLRKNSMLIFIFQVRKVALKPPQKAYSRKVGFKKKTASQKSQTSRQSYQKRRGGKS